MERKKRSKCSGWECCYANKKFGTFGVEMRAFGQKLVKLCTHTLTDTHTTAAKLVVRVASTAAPQQFELVLTHCDDTIVTIPWFASPAPTCWLRISAGHYTKQCKTGYAFWLFRFICRPGRVLSRSGSPKQSYCRRLSPGGSYFVCDLWEGCCTISYSVLLSIILANRGPLFALVFLINFLYLKFSDRLSSDW